MKKILLVLAVAACAKNVKDVHCETGADCVSGQACELDIQECVADAITLDSTGFYDDGTRWWSATDAPALSGTIEATSGATLQAYLGDQQVGDAATITGGAWTLQLPAGTIGTADTTLVLKLSTGTAKTFELAQTFALDNHMPEIQVIGGSVHDERGDTIDFSSGAPMHTHAGPVVTLGGADCPAVYKYAYLMDRQAPTFGGEVSPNPLALQFVVQEATKLDDSASAYRVRTDAGTVLLDWTALASPDASGAYNVALYRDVIPQLGTIAGTFYVDVRFSDWAGHESQASVCWSHNPLAAPLQIGAPAPGELFGMTLPAHSAISRVLNPELPFEFVSVVSQPIVQMTAEPIVLAIAVAQPTGTYRETSIDVTATVATGTGLTCPVTCDGTLCFAKTTDDPRCFPTPAAASAISTSGPIGSFGSAVELVDDTTGLDVDPDPTSGAFVVPARAAGAPAHSYHFFYDIDDVTSLQPAPPLFHEISVGSIAVTGTEPALLAGCNSALLVEGTTGICRAWTQYDQSTAIDKATLSFDPITMTFASSPDPSLAAVPLPYLANSTVVTGALDWDAGDAGLL